MHARALTFSALLSLVCGLALAVPAQACPMQDAKNASPVVLAGDMETEAVDQDLRPDVYGQPGEETAKASSHEGHDQKHENAGDMEHEVLEQEIEPGNAPAGE